MTMTDARVAEIAEAAAEKAVRKTLIMIGLDVDDPISTQKNFAALCDMVVVLRDPEFQKDIAHTRKWRKTVETIETKTMITVVTTIITGMIAAIALGLHDIFGR